MKALTLYCKQIVVFSIFYIWLSYRVVDQTKLEFWLLLLVISTGYVVFFNLIFEAIKFTYKKYSQADIYKKYSIRTVIWFKKFQERPYNFSTASLIVLYSMPFLIVIYYLSILFSKLIGVGLYILQSF